MLGYVSPGYAMLGIIGQVRRLKDSLGHVRAGYASLCQRRTR